MSKQHSSEADFLGRAGCQCVLKFLNFLDAPDEFLDALGAVRPEIHFVKMIDFHDAPGEFLDALEAVRPEIHFVKLREFHDALDEFLVEAVCLEIHFVKLAEFHDALARDFLDALDVFVFPKIGFCITEDLWGLLCDECRCTGPISP